MKKEFWVPCLLHLFVDFFCIYALLSYDINAETRLIWFTVYNCLAFLLQPVIGALIEKSKRNKELASFGCAFVIVGALFPNLYVTSIVSGIGNAMFHVCMGTIVLNKSEKSSPLGAFISFGAIGVGLASVFHNGWLFYSFLFVFAGLTALNMFTSYEFIPYDFKEDFKKEVSKEDLKPLPIIIGLITLGVILRGFFGKYSEINVDISYLVLYIELAMFLGKFVGGFILDLLGGIPLICISLALSILGLFFPSNIYLILLGIFGTNLLMAFTMELVRRSMPNNLGLGFGLLASGLMTGTYIGSFVITYGYVYYIPLILMIINALSLFASLVVVYKKERISRL